jgi:alpha-2-macroglobulin
MRWTGRLAMLALALAPVAASSDESPQVILATPGVDSGAITRFTLRFSAAMVPLGDPRAAAPVDVSCPIEGKGRWVDAQTFVHEFARPLPGGLSCKFALRDRLRTVSGVDIGGQRTFSVDSGGPVARAVLPERYNGEIEEDQAFLVASAMPADPASVTREAYCAVDGLGERIPVEVLPADTAARLLSGLGTDRWEVRSFLESAGLPMALPTDLTGKSKALASITALRCRRALPPGRDVALVWAGQIAAAGGRTAGADQRFDYSVRKPFMARFECGRTNPRAGCNPVEKAYVRFSAPIPMAQAKAISLKLSDGQEIKPIFGTDDKGKATTSDVTFAAPFPESVSGTIVLPADVKDESGRPLSNAARFPLALTFDAAPPLVKFAADFGILEAKQGGVLPVTVRAIEPALAGQTKTISGQALTVEESDVEIVRWLRKVAKAGENASHDEQRGGKTVTINDTGAKPLLAPRSGAALTLDLPGKGKAFEVVGLPLKTPGLHIVELASPALGEALLGRKAPRYVATAALVTNMSVHFKWGRERSLVWVTALDSGKPIGNAQVRITDACTGHEFARGLTSANGLLAVVGKGMPEPSTWAGCESGEATDPHPLIVSARLGEDMSFTLTDWGDGIRPYDFELPFGYEAPGRIVHTLFDRALLRQGETIHMKHIVRQPFARGFSIPKAFSGTLRLQHRGSDTQFDLPLSLSANGSGETSWTAPRGAPMGDYDLVIVQGDEQQDTGQSFRVDVYRLPTMRASVTGPKGAAIRPKTLPLDLFAGYLSGGGASNLPVSLRVGYFDADAAPAGYEAFSFGGSLVAEGTVPLDADGEIRANPLPPTQTLPLTLKTDGTAKASIEVPQTLDRLTRMQVEMDYADPNGETLTASRSILLHSASVQIGIRTDGWLMKQDDLRLKLVALDADGKPAKGQRISVALYSRQVLTARRRLIGGFYAYDNQMKTEKLAKGCTVTSDARGLAACTIDAGISGEVMAVATTTDNAGRSALTSRSVWLAGDDDWWFGGDNGDRMDVIPERTDYKAGETARFQVRMPFRQAQALVTVEREGVLSSYVTTLSGTDPIVEVKLPGAYAPEVYVSVMVVRGRVEGFWARLGHVLNGWGLPVGSPAPTEPTATVDLAKPAYRLGMARVKVGWEASRLAVMVKVDKARYGARDTAQVDISVQRPEGAPAKSADVAFVAVDEALLQLAPNDSLDLLTAMMGERPLSVLTSTAQTQVVGKRHYGRKALEPGGGGGTGDTSALNRENFQPVLLWKGRVALDAQGRARVAVPLSDALSSFKLVAIASDGADLFGTGETSIRTAQDLSLFAGLPPLVRTGDSFAAMFTLRNGSDKAMTVTAQVALSPSVAIGRALTVTIPAGGAVPVSWNLTAPANVPSLRWTVSARSADGKAADRLTVDQAVVPAIPTTVWAQTLLQVGPGSTVPIAPPTGFIAGRGEVRVRLDDSLAPSLEGVRAYMSAYPYNCLEQRLSRIVALGDPAGWALLAGELPAYQAPDGLLRYFPGDTLDGSEALTAYVAAITAEAGLPLPAQTREKMIAALRAVVDGRIANERYGDPRLVRLAAFVALARNNAADVTMAERIGLPLAETPTALLADTLMALDKLPGSGAMKAAAERALRTRLVYEGARLDLSDADSSPWWLMSSTDEAAVKVLLATLGRPGWQAEAPRLMVGAALRQQRGHWDTTPANAWGALTARRFAANYPPGAVTGTTRLTLGPANAIRNWPLVAEARQFTLPLPTRMTPMTMVQRGGSGPWATVSVLAAVPLTKPLEAGYRVERTVEVVQARTKGKLSRGDVLRVILTVTASAERNWVVVHDPVPAGATILGGMANQSLMLDDSAKGGGWWGDGADATPSYIERGQDGWRGYFAWVPRGSFTVRYTLRLGTPGRFQLPPTRVEAMYSPAIRAELPNAPVVVTGP